MLPTTPVRRLFYDIETSPNLVLAFRTGYDLAINHDAIVTERKIICIGYMWEGDKKPHVMRWDKDQNDKELLKKFLVIANEADELIGHHADRFDLPWIRTRCLLHGLDPLPSYKTVDTRAWASKYFLFNSNKLDYLSKVLGHGGKEKMEFDDWKNIVLHKCPKALRKMCHYCGIDVVKLEKVYQDLRFCVKPKTHAGVLGGCDKFTCPRDGSSNVEKHKTRVSASGTVTHQMQCRDCRGFFTISSSAYKEYQAFKAKGIAKSKKPVVKK